eukprot:1157777-Pelagomonas_calceolata.AAC.8
MPAAGAAAARPPPVAAVLTPNCRARCGPGVPRLRQLLAQPHQPHKRAYSSALPCFLTGGSSPRFPSVNLSASFLVCLHSVGCSSVHW